MKFENFLKRNNGNEVAAAKALFAGLRDERGIYLRFEALPSLLDIGNESNREGFHVNPGLIRHYAISHDLKHPEDIIDHLIIGGTEVSCGDYLKNHPIRAHYVDAKRTIRALQERKIIGSESNVYDLVADYFLYLNNNGINLTTSKLQDTLNEKRIAQLVDLEKVADLAMTFGIFLSVCPPKCSPAHNDYSRIKLGNQWKGDYDGKAMAKLLEATRKKDGYKGLSHGMCTECAEYVYREIKEEEEKIKRLNCSKRLTD